jgi:hypothetical protein
MIRLRVQSPSMREQPRRNHAAVVEHQQIARPQHLREIAKQPILPLARSAVEREHPRPRALRRRLLRDQFFRKFEMEIRDQHSTSGLAPQNPRPPNAPQP